MPQISEEDLRDMRLIVDFIVGWWPGLEDAIHFPDNSDDPVYLAAQRLKEKKI